MTGAGNQCDTLVARLGHGAARPPRPRHARRRTNRGWRLRDLGSTNGTRLNGVRVGTGQLPLRLRDLVQFGEVATVVEALVEDEPEVRLETPGDGMRVEATAQSRAEFEAARRAILMKRGT